ncbi:MAG: citrate/2-methylcitrate synthase, partial [Candidatus Zixiibacteriota bacterium]
MNQEKWKTYISEIKPGEIRVRGYDIAVMMEKLSFAQAVFLVLKGEMPSPEQSKMMEAILVSSID